MKKILSTLLFVFSSIFIIQAQTSVFKIMPLGVHGGSDESNLSAYMVAPEKSEHYVCLDAGTLYAGIRKAVNNRFFHNGIHQILRQNIKGYLISHGHLDHISGMVINSPEDTSKNIYGLANVITILREKYFTWESWANFTDEGEKPTLNKYHYVTLEPATEIPLAETEMSVTAFPLSHVNPYLSTAFLVRYQDSYLLYLGDTGPDELEKSEKLSLLWQHIAPLIQSKKLKGIMIETSFPDEQPDKLLFGHLTPKWLMKEMNVLSELTGKKALENFPIVITHIKPSGDNEMHIREEIMRQNVLGLKIIFPQQGVFLRL